MDREVHATAGLETGATLFPRPLGSLGGFNVRRRDGRSRAERQFGDAGFIQHRHYGLLRLCPDGMSRAEAFALAIDLMVDAKIQADGAVNGLDDRADGGGASGGQNLKAACLAALGDDESGSAKGLQNLG